MRDDRFDAFSALLLQLYRASAETSLETFQDTALDILKQVLPFDGAMWGTATFVDGVGIDIHTIHLHEQAPEMIVEYEEVKHLDTSAALVSGRPHVTKGFHSHSWFDGGSRWDDYREWQRRHGHENVFITAATSICFPVISVDGKPIGNGHPGSIAQNIREAFFGVAEKTLI